MSKKFFITHHMTRNKVTVEICLYAKFGVFKLSNIQLQYEECNIMFICSKESVISVFLCLQFLQFFAFWFSYFQNKTCFLARCGILNIENLKSSILAHRWILNILSNFDFPVKKRSLETSYSPPLEINLWKVNLYNSKQNVCTS